MLPPQVKTLEAIPLKQFLKELWFIEIPLPTLSGSISATLKKAFSAFDSVHLFFFLLRLLTIAGALIFYFFTGNDYSAHQLFVVFFPVYIIYSAVLYTCIFLWPKAISKFYLAALVCDMCFVFALILFVGLFVGSFFLAFYLLTAIHAYYFGLRIGCIAALVASSLYTYTFILLDGGSLIPWADFLLRIGFLLLSAISLGFLSEKSKREKKLLAEAYNDASQSIRVKDEFLASLSHEVRTPLTHIMGYAELLAMGTYGKLAALQQTPLHKVINASKQLLGIFERLVEFSRHKAGHIRPRMEEIDLSRFLHESLGDCLAFSYSQAMNNGHLEFSVITPPHPVILRSDRTLLRQVISNLVSNALKYTKEGFVRISLEDTQAGQVKIVVEDSGIGIKPSELALICNEFYRGSDEMVQARDGLGLGLAIVSRSLRLLGGDLQTHSIYTRGSKFIVSLPT
ncbi:MAG: HAMP domain-containing histidine kinase [Deltaproteobacteria bacterium]|nr:HAMP domain-containing histidine kinase [Deltaproteobacteria bacterium]